MSPESAHTFFTCARPGRKYSSVDPVPDDMVRDWLRNVCALGSEPAIVSLLGRKPDGTSEYAFYSFFGGFDRPEEHRGELSFGEWLSKMAPAVSLHEHPTVDFQAIPAPTLDEIAIDVRTLISRGRTVVVVDSGGETRTGRVCKELGAKEAFPTVA